MQNTFLVTLTLAPRINQEHTFLNMQRFSNSSIMMFLQELLQNRRCVKEARQKTSERVVCVSPEVLSAYPIQPLILSHSNLLRVHRAQTIL